MYDIQEALAANAVAVEKALDRFLRIEDENPERRLTEAMRYSTLDGGKRIRPFLVVSSAALFNVSKSSARRVAAALEMVHCYSLVHDDLPAMDNDDLRRGKPTCHIKYDEATAVLAGDALLTKAFEILAHADTHQDARVRADLVIKLAKAAGDKGMVGGQMLDLMAETRELKMAEITRLQRMKTGMLICYACDAGAILGKAPKSARRALRAYAHDLGLAFQIVDDLLDVEGDEKELGKKTGKDAGLGKATFVSLLGAKRAREQADLLATQAVEHLEIFEKKADPLKNLAQYVVKRRT